MEQETQLKNIIEQVVPSNDLHARWLNTLSMMENTGARKISAYEHPVHSGIVVLKHAAEEARHAYYLKKQIGRLDPDACPDYSFPYLLAPVHSYHYLHELDMAACRYIRRGLGLGGRQMKHAAYLLVTYAIEVRADMLYGIYQDALTAAGWRVNVRSIIVEEEGHLAEMERMLKEFHPQWQQFAADVLAIENGLFSDWLMALSASLPALSAAGH